MTSSQFDRGIIISSKPLPAHTHTLPTFLTKKKSLKNMKDFFFFSSSMMNRYEGRYRTSTNQQLDERSIAPPPTTSPASPSGVAETCLVLSRARWREVVKERLAPRAPIVSQSTWIRSGVEDLSSSVVYFLCSA